MYAAGDLKVLLSVTPRAALNFIAEASSELDCELTSSTSMQVADALTAAQGRGVRVRLRGMAPGDSGSTAGGTAAAPGVEFLGPRSALRDLGEVCVREPASPHPATLVATGTLGANLEVVVTRTNDPEGAAIAAVIVADRDPGTSPPDVVQAPNSYEDRLLELLRSNPAKVFARAGQVYDPALVNWAKTRGHGEIVVSQNPYAQAFPIDGAKYCTGLQIEGSLLGVSTPGGRAEALLGPPDLAGGLALVDAVGLVLQGQAARAITGSLEAPCGSPD
ncbi:MAG: hypothetical protein ACYC9D_01775 [Candidatus Dormibacteria bacterium]